MRIIRFLGSGTNSSGMSTSAVEAANKNDNLSEILKSPKVKVRVY